MKLTARVSAIAVAACAAVALPVTALAATGQSAAGAQSAQPASAAAHCSASQLTGWLGVPGDGSAGTETYQLELTDTSPSACTLYAYPGVSALSASGHQLGSAAIRDSEHPKRLITLHRGGTAHFELDIVDAGNYPAGRCHQKTAESLRVYPPNDRGSLRIPFTFAACSKKGPKYLGVTTAVSGAGVPGFSS